MELLTLAMASKRKVEVNTIYIDPTFGSNGVGTISNPKNTIAGLTITDNYTYRFKCATTFSNSAVLDLSNRTNVIVTSYGSGAIPIFNFTGSGSYAVRFNNSTNCAFVNIELQTDITRSLVTLIQSDTGNGNTIAGCKIHGVKEGAVAGGICIRGGGTNLSIINNEIYDSGDDGLYLVDTTNLNVGYNYIHHVGQNYAGTAKGFLSIGTGSLGDGIQMGGTWPNFYIHHNVIDRTDIYTGNKFGVIFNSAPGANSANGGIFEHNTVKVRSGADMSYGVYGEQGNNMIFRYNRIQGATGGIRVSGIYCLNYKIHNNIFTDCDGSSVAMVNVGGYPTDTLIYNNVFARGSGIYAYVSLNGGNAVVRNNIYDNSISAFYAAGGATYTKTHNCYQDPAKVGTGGLGTGEITGNPLFVDAVGNDFHLQVASICRNAGIDVGTTEDFDGSLVPSLNLGVYF